MDREQDVERGGDPDRQVLLAEREVAAVLGLARALALVADDDPAAVEAAAAALDDCAARLLPEVGLVRDDESFRLFVHRLHDRLAAVIPGVRSELPPPPVTVPPERALPLRRGSRSAAVVDEPLADAFVWWDDITEGDVVRYRPVEPLRVRPAPGRVPPRMSFVGRPADLRRARGGEVPP